MPQPRPDIQIDDDYPECKPFGYHAKQAIISLIEEQELASERREWASIAVSEGIISEEEASALCRPKFKCPMCGVITRELSHDGCNWRVDDHGGGLVLWTAKK